MQVSTASRATTHRAAVEAEEEEEGGAAKVLEAATLSTKTQWATAGEMATWVTSTDRRSGSVGEGPASIPAKERVVRWFGCVFFAFSAFCVYSKCCKVR